MMRRLVVFFSLFDFLFRCFIVARVVVVVLLLR